MGIRHAFVSAKSDGADPTEVQPSHWNADHVGTAGWEEELVKSSDQTVSSSTALVDATDLAFAVTSGSYWRFEIELIYSGTSTSGDFKTQLAVSAGNMTGWYRFVGSDSTGDTINVTTGVRVAGLAVTAANTGGTDASGSLRTMFIEGMFMFSSAATFKVQFAQNSAAGATTLKTGSTFRGRRMI